MPVNNGKWINENNTLLKEAIQVLYESGLVMSERDLVYAIQKRGQVQLGGRTPQNTVCTVLSKYINYSRGNPVIAHVAPSSYKHINGHAPNYEVLEQRLQEYQSEGQMQDLRTTLTTLHSIVKTHVTTTRGKGEKSAHELKQLLLQTILATGPGQQQSQFMVDPKTFDATKSQHEPISAGRRTSFRTNSLQWWSASMALGKPTFST
jgi:hypothetical protein